jgi:hypothetical protein
MNRKRIIKMATTAQPSMEYLMKLYEARKRQNQQKLEWAKTERGKEYQKMKAKEYYQRNKEKVLEKRKARYEADRETLLNRAKEYYHTKVKPAKEAEQKN